MTASSIKRVAKVAGILALAVSLSGCIFVPERGPRYGYYHPHPYGYY